MPLKAKIDSLDSVDEALRGFYTEQDGSFVLQVTGMVPKEKVDEFRNNNIALAEERDTLKATVEAFGDFKPEEIKDLRTKAAKAEEIIAAQDGKLDDAVKQATERMREDFSGQLEAKDEAIAGLTQERDGFKNNLATVRIDTALQKTAAELGVKPTAIDDFTRRGRETFFLGKEGEIVPLKGADGPTLYGQNAEPMTMAEWGKLQMASAPHLFEESGGGGAGGKRGDGDKGVTIDPNQPNAIGQNLEKFASGEARLAE